LLSKMKDILTNESRFVTQDKDIRSRFEGNIDIGYPPKKNTLNAGFRKRELERITIENYNILRRIQDKKSQFDVIGWEKERKKQENMLGNLCEFPPAMANKIQKPR